MNHSMKNPRGLKACALWLALFAVCGAWASQAAAQPASPQAPGPAMEVVFVLDTTGSMRGLIQGAKQKIWDLANALTQARPEPRLKFGLVAYRDLGDQYVTLLGKLSEDMDQTYQELLSYRARGGGDFPESVNQALYEAVTKINWSVDPKVFRTIFLVGDAWPHMDYQGDVKFQKTCALAREKGIFINTVRCGSHPVTGRYWREIARLGGGDFFSILQSGGMRHIKTPYDRELAALGRKLDRTVTPYGQKALEKRARQMKRSREIEAAAPTAALAGRAAYKTKAAGGKTLLAGRDLVSDYASGRVDPAKVKKSDLPPKLRGLSPEQLKDKLRKEMARRQATGKAIKELHQKRNLYIAQRQKKAAAKETSKGFDKVVMLAVQKQAAQKGIRIDFGG